MATKTFNIHELSASAWECAIDNVLEIMSRKSFRILTKRNDWALAQSYATEKNIQFDLNGNIVKE